MEDLPDEILALILALLPCPDRACGAMAVCKRWHAIGGDPDAMGRPVCTRPESHPPSADGWSARDIKKRPAACRRALCLGHIDCLFSMRPPNGSLDEQLWLYAGMYPIPVSTLDALDGVAKGTDHYDDLLGEALDRGDIACTSWLLKRGARFGNVNGCDCHPSCNHLRSAWVCDKDVGGQAHAACLRLLLDDGQRVDTDACEQAVHSGHIECLRVLFQHGYTCEDTLAGIAAEHGRLDVLRLMHEYKHEWGASATQNAALGGHIDCLRYLYEIGCPWDKWTCYRAASKSSVDCLRFAREHGCPWDKIALVGAASNGNLETMTYAHENGCPWSGQVCVAAAQRGSLACLQYAREHGCPWDSDVCTTAAQYGHLDCLQYAHENGCAWDSQVCVAAAQYGHLDCLRYAHENGCTWNTRVCTMAVDYGHLDCLQYARGNGCPWDRHNITERCECAPGWGCRRILCPGNERRRLPGRAACIAYVLAQQD
ncbi:Ankyrin repeat domain containing protein [Pandoravirus neocaledonia]|uniref:Ankyrin repeat domain containing protein n=1 Tax=Pandoravirus neocaledonia TaxID=2107708 RepID=A0A2U7UCK8_9VIRU|nr:Ankyrin repeat domain containing protein [Pandoravirus neocaledonia]AVK76070.1 Ankyrin repeat domain containing protein [Pandoravirus neocaledonia]